LRTEEIAVSFSVRVRLRRIEASGNVVHSFGRCDSGLGLERRFFLARYKPKNDRSFHGAEPMQDQDIG
jgi:hypothetical protein